MKKALLVIAGCLFLSVAVFAAAPPPASPGADGSAPSVGTTLTDDELQAILGVPKPVDEYTYITWSGGTCTAWMFCTGEPYWKCQSTRGDCQVTACSMTCNGNTRRCLPRTGCVEPIPE